MLPPIPPGAMGLDPPDVAMESGHVRLMCGWMRDHWDQSCAWGGLDGRLARAGALCEMGMGHGEEACLLFIDVGDDCKC